MNPVCNYFGLLFVNYCLINNQTEPQQQISSSQSAPHKIQLLKSGGFETEFQWQYINFTWHSPTVYRNAIKKEIYIPGNVVMTGIKYHKDRIYFAMPQIRSGVPATLGYITLDDETRKFNPLITPFPSWEMNVRKDCTTLQSVQGMEIDRHGIMWVIDGVRTNNRTSRCPPKLVLLDLNNNGRVIISHNFPNAISLRQGGYLNDIVLDDSEDGFYAYITDNSAIDPGLVVYSQKQNRAWKFRDSSMYPEVAASGYTVGNVPVNNLKPIDGIALTPQHANGRTVLFSSLTGTSLYGVGTSILKNETMYRSGDWRSAVRLVGRKQGTGDGMIVDDEGNLYYTLVSHYAVGKWNIKSPFSTATVVDQDKKVMVWPDSFTFDDQGNLRLLCDNMEKFTSDIGGVTRPEISGEVMFRILKLHTGTKSYIYS